MDVLVVPVTHETREILERHARARSLRAEDVAGEILDLYARRSAQAERQIAAIGRLYGPA